MAPAIDVPWSRTCAPPSPASASKVELDCALQVGMLDVDCRVDNRDTDWLARGEVERCVNVQSSKRILPRGSGFRLRRIDVVRLNAPQRFLAAEFGHDGPDLARVGNAPEPKRFVGECDVSSPRPRPACGAAEPPIPSPERRRETWTRAPRRAGNGSLRLAPGVRGRRGSASAPAAWAGAAAVWRLQPSVAASATAGDVCPTASGPALGFHWPSWWQCRSRCQSRCRFQSDRIPRGRNSSARLRDPILREGASQGLACTGTRPNNDLERIRAPSWRRPQGRRKPRSLFQRLRTASWRIPP